MDKSAYERWLGIDEVHFWRRGKRELVLEWLTGALGEPRGRTSGLALLDVGGATTLLTRELSQFGKVTVVEPEASCVALFADDPVVTAVQGGLPGLPVEGPFDCITLIDVLEHLDDDLNGLCELYSKLKPGGYLLMTVPAYPWLWSDHDVAVHHKRRYTRTTLEPVIAAAGFETARLSYYTSLLLPIMAAQRLGNRFKPKRRNASETPEYDVKVPFAPLNLAFGAAMRAERALLGRGVTMPAGGALVALLRRPFC